MERMKNKFAEIIKDKMHAHMTWGIEEMPEACTKECSEFAIAYTNYFFLNALKLGADHHPTDLDFMHQNLFSRFLDEYYSKEKENRV